MITNYHHQLSNMVNRAFCDCSLFMYGHHAISVTCALQRSLLEVNELIINDDWFRFVLEPAGYCSVVSLVYCGGIVTLL